MAEKNAHRVLAIDVEHSICDSFRRGESSRKVHGALSKHIKGEKQ